ncbi:MAG: sulfite exporter TauE/SafE family protein [Acidobacteria bacterium]|nr:sulfite exporter TauE/SafE family protein [Acidobacteriota bacterium]
MLASYALAGFCVGALVGMTGVGGGSLMTPLLILLFGIHPVVAVGTDLLYAAVTKSVGTLVHGYTHTVDWRVVRHLSTGSIPMAIVTLGALSLFDLSGAHAARLTSRALGAALLVTALALVFRASLLAYFGAHFPGLRRRRADTLTVVMGGILGVLVSISSVGAGAIGVTALIILYPELSMPRIVGSDIAHAVPLTLIAGTGHWILGSVDTGILGSLLTGSIPGIVVGSWMTIRVSDWVLRFILAASLFIVGGRLVM